MNKIFLIFLLFILLFICSSCNETEYIRLRIIANSNEIEDVEEKTLIKEAIKQLFDKNELNYQILSVDNVKNKLQDVLPSNLYNKLIITKCISYYPAKSYNNKFIKSGNYETLLIEIDEAKGNNFWTLLYPEYFGIEFEETNEIEYRSYIYDQFFNKTKQMKN